MSNNKIEIFQGHLRTDALMSIGNETTNGQNLEGHREEDPSTSNETPKGSINNSVTQT